MGQLITGLANNHSHSHLQLKSKELLIACLWTVGENWRTQTEPTQIQGETPPFCITHVSLMAHKAVVKSSNNEVKI